jgi:superfamily II DNA or RNA helicase
MPRKTSAVAASAAAAPAARNDGLAFEYYSAEYHRAKYGDFVWHSSVIPEEDLFAAGIFHEYNGRRMMRNAHLRDQRTAGGITSPYVDDGVDFLAKRPAPDPSKAPTYHVGQAKNYATRKVSQNDLTGFYRNMWLTRAPGYLYTTSPLEARLRDDLLKHPNWYTHEHLTFDAARAVAPSASQSLEVFRDPRDYQSDVLRALTERLSQDAEPHKMILHIGCGLGKTLIAGNLFAGIKNRRRPELYVCIAPLRVSVANLKDRLMPFFNATASCSSAPQFRALLVDSDAGGTTDAGYIGRLLKTREPTVIFATFESFFGLLTEEFGEYLIDEDAFLLVDEMHNLTRAQCRVVNEYQTSLLMSATVPEQLRYVLDAKEIYRYTMADGIRNGYLCDYEVVLPLLKRATPTPTDSEAATPNRADDASDVAASNAGEAEEDLAADDDGRKRMAADVDISDGFPADDVTGKALFLCAGMLQTGSRRCIAYLRNTEECAAFAHMMRRVCDEFHGIRLWCETMDHTVGARRRGEILRDFQANSPEYDLFVIASIRILDEAVDLPRCDSEFIANVGDRASDIRTVQRLQRGGRLDPDNPSKKNHMFMWCTEWSCVLNALTIMRQEDPMFYKKLRTMSASYDRLGDPAVQRESRVRAEELQAYAEVRCVTLSELWERRRRVWSEIRERLGRIPKNNAEEEAERFAAQWCSHQRCAYKKGELPEERVLALNHTSGWSWGVMVKVVRTDWEQQRQIWQDIAQKLGCDPNQNAEEENERRAASWHNTQRIAYKKGKLTKERVLALQNTPGWSWSIFIDWEKQRQIWQDIAQHLGCDPSMTSKQLDQRRAAYWGSKQRKAYKKGKLAAERVFALQNTPGWSWVCLLDWEQRRQIWHGIAQQLGRDPSKTSEKENERHSAEWCSNQRTAYNKGLLAEERVLALQNTPGWSWVGLTDWDQRRQIWQDIAQHLGCDPSSIAKQLDQRRAAKWCGTQRTAYKKGLLAEERVLALNKTPGWSWSRRAAS